MAIVINGSGTVTGLAVGGLPDGTVDSGTIATGTIVDADVANVAASKLTGALPAISAASLTNVPKDVTVGGRKNIIINGDFRTNQYGLTASSVNITNGGYNIDRWKNYEVGISGTVALGDAEAIDGTYEKTLKYTATSTASGRLGGYQAVEDYHFGETLTASAWVKSDHSNARLFAYDGSTETNSNTHTGGGGWEKLTVTFTQRTNAAQLYIWAAIASSSLGSVSVASGSYIYIAKFQCERGSVATSFERLNDGEQLALCQRYYLAYMGGGIGTGNIGIGYYTLHNYINGYGGMFPVTMRATPSFLITNGTSYWNIYRRDASDFGDTISASGISTRGFSFVLSGNISGTQTDTGVVGLNNAAGKLHFIAEL